jgi:AhpD family alkylhydroperoxidase
MAITAKEKELVAVGISVATGCKPCTDYHFKAVRKARVSDEEIRQAVADALSVRESATKVMEAYALAHLGEKPLDSGSSSAEEANRIKELVSIGAAFGVNGVLSLENHLAAAKRMNIPSEDIATILKLGEFIKGKAASHVKRLAGTTLEEEQLTAYQEEVGGCS